MTHPGEEDLHPAAHGAPSWPRSRRPAALLIDSFWLFSGLVSPLFVFVVFKTDIWTRSRRRGPRIAHADILLKGVPT